jgi:hypothetical protein
VWDTIFSNHYTADYHLFIALAMVTGMREKILHQSMLFEDLLKVLLLFEI